MADTIERLATCARQLLDAAAEIERLHAKLTTACRQWKMYAEMEESRDLLHEQSPEGELYRSVCADYASHAGH